MPDRSRYVARAQFLGVQRIEIGGEVVTPEAELLFAMIVRLSVPLGRITSRQTMMETLWPGTDEANARHNLRQTVYKAREIGLVVESGEDGLRLDPRHWSCDWDDPDGDVGGEWLTGYATPFSEELGAWVSSQRVGVHALIRPRIVRALQRARSAGELALADQYAVQLLRIDELNEEATLTRAEVMAMHGAKVDALRLLDAYLDEIGRLGAGRDAALPASLLRRRIAEKLPVVTYQNGSSHHGQLVGRERESRRLFASLFDTRGGRGTAIALSGQEGCGKSRLLYEMKKAAVLQGIRTLEISVDSTPTTSPSLVPHRLVKQLLTLPGSIGVSPEALESLRNWLGLSEQTATQCPLVELEDLLAAVSEETPLVVLIDHCDQLAPETLDLIARIYRRGRSRHHSIILAASSLEAFGAAGSDAIGIELLPVQRLTPSEIEQVVQAYAAAELPRATRAQISCAALFAEGNPMFGIEMLGLVLDQGSPDKIPWRVQASLERTVREMSGIQRRTMALCSLLEGSATHTVLHLALDISTPQFVEATERLERCGYVTSLGGSLRASPLLAEVCLKHSRAGIRRLDARRAAQLLLEKAEQSPTDFYASIRLLIAAGEEVLAHRTIDERIGSIIRKDTAESLADELARLLAMATLPILRSAIEEARIQIVSGAHSKRFDESSRQLEARPRSLPVVSRASRDFEYTLSSGETLRTALFDSRDPNSSPAKRMADAVMALVLAFNRDDHEAVLAAYQATGSVRHSSSVNPFDICRADVIYHCYLGDRTRACEHAQILAEESRRVKNVELACKGMRNAAQALSAFGDLAGAQRLLLESRELAATLKYSIQVAWADISLADLCIEGMDVEGASAYLNSASEIASRHAIHTPLLAADIDISRCWMSLMRNDFATAQRCARSVAREFQSAQAGTALWTRIGTRLATFRGKRTKSEARDFDTLKRSIGSRAFYPTEQTGLAALLLFTKETEAHNETCEFVRSQFPRIVATGRQIWPFLMSHLGSD